MKTDKWVAYFKIGNWSDEQVRGYPPSGSLGDPRVELEMGELYWVEAIQVGGWSTRVKLEGIDVWFNSVFFDFYKEADPTSDPELTASLREAYAIPMKKEG